ncbi:hypothetical protein [Streptomyces sp. NBRC 110028]|uniref:hypothetical protein n=1 Tax=Streptomyces sp. NBRC 110028 TaxID=1621260 RepID=UPI0006E34C98|nr:hypothetical protein [Streptomyces sp. NBRC 110028]
MVTYERDTLVSAAFQVAGPSLSSALMPRLRQETLSLLRSRERLPAHLVGEVFASGDRELLEALAGARAGAERQAEMLRLAELADPGLARTLYTEPLSGTWRQHLRRTVLSAAAAHPADPGWRAPGGLVDFLLSATASYDLLPALEAPFPEVVRHVLEKIGTSLDVSQQLRACRAALTHGGVAEVAALAELPAVHPAVVEVVRRVEVAQDPAAVLEAAVEAASVGEEAAAEPEAVEAAPAGDELVRRLRELTYGMANPSLDAVDWELLLAEEKREPFSGRALLLLASRPDCPDELVLAMYRRSSDPLPATSPLPWRLLTETDWKDGYHHDRLARLLRRGIREGAFPVDRVLAEVRPASRVLASLPYGTEPLGPAVAALLEPLGGGFAAWRALYSLLPRFTGSSTELVAAAVEQQAKHRGKTWPRPLKAEYPVKRPDGLRGVFLQLFLQATEEVQTALAPHLDRRGVQHLLVFHQPSSALRDQLVNLHGTSVLACAASDWELPADKIEELLAHDEPEINTNLYVYTALTDEQRRGVLAGRRFGAAPEADGTPDAEPLPITDELIEHIRLSGRRHWLLPICDSGDPRLARLLLGKIKLHTLAGQLRLLVRVWERHGAEEVRGLLEETEFPERRSRKHPLPKATHEIVRSALEAADGPAVLRAELDRSRGPAGRVAFLRAQGATRDLVTPALERLAEEAGPGLPWAELAREHERDPLPDALLVVLAEADDCPEGLRTAGGVAALRLEHHAHPHKSTGPRPDPLDLVRHHPLPPPPHRRNDWLDKAVGLGTLTPLDVLYEARPAGDAAAYLAYRHNRARQDGPDPAGLAASRKVLELATTHLGEDPEAWALALRLLPDFTGTFPELLSTAAAIVS